MTFPFWALSDALRQQGLVVAVLIGVAFGFVLERAGFGRADKLAAQFYLRDLRVFKVMFTAIVTAMLGLMIVAGLGLTDLRAISESIASFTWIWPMVAGGFLLGIGFIVSGYCPGTSVVAAGSGNVDGAVTVAGVITGTFVYSELLRIDVVKEFHTSSERGAWFLYDLLGVSPQLLAAAIAVLAVLAFIGAEKLESVMGGARTAPRLRRYAFATVSALAAVAVITLAMPAADAVASEPPATITAKELARKLADEPWSVRIVDVRDSAAYAKDRVPGSENIPPSAVPDLPEDGRALVIVGFADARSHPGAREVSRTAGASPRETSLLAAAERGRRISAGEGSLAKRPDAALETPSSAFGTFSPAGGGEGSRQHEHSEGVVRIPPHARLLAGGIAAWHAEPLVQAMTSGAPPPPPPARSGGAIAKPKKKGGGCSA